MKTRSTVVGDVFVLAILESKVDSATGPSLKQQVVAAKANGHRKIVLDCSQVVAMDSTGLGALVGALKVVAKEGTLAVCACSETVKMMFKLTRMDQVFRAFPSAIEAVQALAAPGVRVCAQSS